MTPLEMIKKYEGIKKELKDEQYKVPPKAKTLYALSDSIGIIDWILRDLNDVAHCSSVGIIKAKVLTKLNNALDEDDYDGARNLAHAFMMLPK